MAKIKVTAGEGRTVPVHSSLASAPGASLLYLKPGDELEVEETHPLVQRSLRNGDFVPVVAPSSPAKSTKTKEG